VRAEDFINEAPLGDYELIGNFDKTGGAFRKDVDRKLVSHPVTQQKAEIFFKELPNNLRLFFVNKPGLTKHRESGSYTPDQIRTIMGPDADQIINGSEDSITVVFLGNYGVNWKMMTPWIMAHRIGHAMSADSRGKRDDEHAWPIAERAFFSTINNVLSKVYRVNPVEQSWASRSNRDRYMPGYSEAYRALFQAIGTQKSSREGKLNRPYEFLYELFAQFIQKGYVTLNPFPQSLGYGRKAWGRTTRYMSQDREQSQYMSTMTNIIQNDLTIVFTDVLNEMEGKIFLM
jgi:hypothetical protein